MESENGKVIDFQEGQRKREPISYERSQYISKLIGQASVDKNVVAAEGIIMDMYHKVNENISDQALLFKLHTASDQEILNKPHLYHELMSLAEERGLVK